MGKPRKFYPKKLSKKKSKVELKFDSSERREFLTGFQKRKAERKQKAKNELKEKQREEKILLRQKQREKMRELAQSQGTVPEVQQLIEEEGETVTYELPKQVVSITTFDAKQISGSLGMSLGHNTNKAKTNQDNEQSD